MTLIIPGVEIRVIKELVPRQLGATGILGIVGFTEIDRSGEALRAVASLAEFRELFGAGSVRSMPEVALAFANGVREVVVANLPSAAGSQAQVPVPVQVGGATRQVQVMARTPGRHGNDCAVRVIGRTLPDGAGLVDVEVFTGGDKPEEVFRGLSAVSTDVRFWPAVLGAESALVRAVCVHVGGVLPVNQDAGAAPLALTGGGEATVGAYTAPLERLECASEVDLVCTSADYRGLGAADMTTGVCALVASHCQRMSTIARNRIGFGQIPWHGTARPDVAAVKQMAAVLTSDRFALVAPWGYLGAVVGCVAGLAYFESPTFKTLVTGSPRLTFDFSDSDLRALLTAGVLPVDQMPRKGICIVKGISTDTDQLSVRRIADRAVRAVQNIAQDFIGLLNTQAQRLALKQLVTGELIRMANENALVPSADGASPPFQVDVESSPMDFAQGIVRIHCAVRPVRAIDYIYATILVQAQ